MSVNYLQKEKLLINLRIFFSEPVSYELLINIINNPKIRLQWDHHLLKMIIFLGSDLLDGKINCLNMMGKGSVVYERIVRRIDDKFYILYRPYDESLRDDYEIFIFERCVTVLQVFSQSVEKKIEEILDGKAKWAENLLKEVKMQNKSYNNANKDSN